MVHPIPSDTLGARGLRMRLMLSWNRFRHDRSAATAVEFALVSGAFLMTVLFILVVALILYLTQALDYATSKAARQVMLGNVQKNSITQSNFRTSLLCPYLPAALSCANVIVNLQTVPEAPGPAGYYAFVNGSATALNIPTLSNTGAQYSAGSQGSYEYLQVIYPVTFFPAAFSRILGGGATYNGAPAYLIVSTAAFRNEQF